MGNLLNMSGGSLLNKGLPYDYEVEYLGFEKTHSFKIDTDVIYKRNMGFGCEVSHFECTYIGTGSSGYSPLIGNTASRGSWATFYVCPTNYPQYIGETTLDYGSTTYRLSVYIKGTDKQKIELRPYNTTQLAVFLNDTQKKTVNSFTPTQNNSITFLNTPIYNYEGRLYRLFVYDTDGTYLFDAIPVRVGQVGYMYDKVSGQLFGNAGTGAFILGPDKTN